MSRPISSTFRQEVFAQQTGECWIILLQISHPDLSDDIFISSDATQLLPIVGARGTISNGQEYIFLPFDLTLQEQNDNLLAKAILQIDNVDRSIIAAIRQASGEPPRMTIRIVLASDTDTIEIEMPNLEFNNIYANQSTVQGELRPKILQGEQFPNKTFNQADFPGVFGG